LGERNTIVLRSESAFNGDGNGKSLESLGSVQGFMRKGGGFSDRSHESFYALIMRCGKEKNLAGRLAKVQELVDVQRRNVVLLSRRVSPEFPQSRKLVDRLEVSSQRGRFKLVSLMLYVILA
jgi:hypothetical protein